MSDLVPARARNAAATRSAILDAARDRFTRDSYDDVGLRDIAGDVGVDAALISRYFGSKEDLFSAALDSCHGRTSLIEGDRASFGERVARELIFGDMDRCKYQGLLIVLRSMSSSKAAEIVRGSSEQRFYGPLADWIGGEDRAIRAHLVASLIKGVAVGRETTGDFSMTRAQREEMCARLARTLQALIDD